MLGYFRRWRFKLDLLSYRAKFAGLFLHLKVFLNNTNCQQKYRMSSHGSWLNPRFLHNCCDDGDQRCKTDCFICIPIFSYVRLQERMKLVFRYDCKQVFMGVKILVIFLNQDWRVYLFNEILLSLIWIDHIWQIGVIYDGLCFFEKVKRLSLAS